MQAGSCAPLFLTSFGVRHALPGAFSIRERSMKAIRSQVGLRASSGYGYISMKTIQARVTRNVKEDPSVEDCDIWNVETVLLERLPREEVSLTADPNEIQVEQIPGSKLDATRSILTIRTKGHSPLKAGSTIHVDVRITPSKNNES